MVAAATINFSLACMGAATKLLFEGAIFIYLRRSILDCVVHEDCSTEDWFTKTVHFKNKYIGL